jgi:hypothetical protein
MSEPATQAAERRSAERVPVHFTVSLGRAGAEALGPATARNISAAGMLVRAEGELPLWARLSASLPEIGAREVRVVRRDGQDFGCLFLHPLESAELDAVLGSDDVRAGASRARAEADVPPPPEKRGMLRLWKR